MRMWRKMLQFLKRPKTAPPPPVESVHPGLETRLEEKRQRLLARLDKASGDINRTAAGAVTFVVRHHGGKG